MSQAYIRGPRGMHIGPELPLSSTKKQNQIFLVLKEKRFKNDYFDKMSPFYMWGNWGLRGEQTGEQWRCHLCSVPQHFSLYKVPVLHSDITVNTSERKLWFVYLSLSFHLKILLWFMWAHCYFGKVPARPTSLDLRLTQTNLPFFPLLTPTVIFLKGEWFY